jgi:ubiquinone/menaquinone biosynthesis C-methylase UbiE
VTAWYEESFGKDYLLVYKHRDVAGAYAEVQRMAGWLNLPAGADVLDLCCGMGRHSMALVDAGYQVTGIDLSGVLLNEARRLDKEQRVEWHQGDMRNLPFADEAFQAVVNLFTSFGYFNEEEQNEQVLRGIHRVLRPGGRYIIDFLNAEYIKARLVPYSERTDDGLTIQETRSIEEGFVRKRIVVKEEGQQDRQYLEQVRLYGLQHFTEMLSRVGLSLDEVYGGYDGQPFDPGQSPRLILIGTKKDAKVGS